MNVFCIAEYNLFYLFSHVRLQRGNGGYVGWGVGSMNDLPAPVEKSSVLVGIWNL